MEPQFIDDTKALQTFIESLPDCTYSWPSLYFDLEGNDLSRHGTLSLLTVLVEPRHTVHIIDVTKLGKEAFSTAGLKGQSMKSILEADNIIKAFFDIRNDSDALFSHYGVRVAGIEDLQLMELASRASSKRLVHGLARCIGSDADLEFEERRRASGIKDKGRKLFAPERGGSYTVFDLRPLPDEIKQYCIQDVTLLPKLREVYLAKLCDAWWLKVQEETAARICLSQSPNYNGKGRHMAEAPREWTTWYPSQVQRDIKTLVGKKRSPTTTATTPTTANTDMTVASDAPPSEISAGVFGQRHVSVAAALASLSIGPGYDFSKIQRLARKIREDSSDQVEYTDRYSLKYSDDDEEGTGPDLTACDKGCGYCGRCMY